MKNETITQTNEDINSSLKTYIYALGGLNEVGKNTYCIEHGNNIVIIDAGVKFPEFEEYPGVDYIIPDYSYLVKNSKKVKALFITHGHEDHIGGIPFLLQSVPVPVIYASKLSAGLIKLKLNERDMSSENKKIQVIDNDSVIKIGPLTFRFFATTHSIPDSYGIIIDTPNGRIVTTGDFKVDLTPPSKKDIDFAKITKLAKEEIKLNGGTSAEGVTLYLADSTNAEVEGYSKSETEVAVSIDEILNDAPGRVIVATFASNVHRIQQIISSAKKHNRTVLVFGRSMRNAIEAGRQLGYIQCSNDDVICDGNDNERRIPTGLELKDTLILCTGSQGEPMAALSRIANNSHPYIHIIPGDTIVFSSNPIPGNLSPVTKVINMLSKQMANVITNSALYSVHTSGHAQREELKLMLKLFSPKYFMPVHGEYRMLKLHADLAIQMGICKKENTFILKNGEVLVMSNGSVKKDKRIIEASSKYIDGSTLLNYLADGVDDAVIADRKLLSNDGLVAVVVPIDAKTSEILHRPSIVSRGFIYLTENGALLTEAENEVYKVLYNLMKNKKRKINFAQIKNVIRESVSNFVKIKTNRSPIVIPVILNKREETL